MNFDARTSIGDVNVSSSVDGKVVFKQRITDDDTTIVHKNTTRHASDVVSKRRIDNDYEILVII